MGDAVGIGGYSGKQVSQKFVSNMERDWSDIFLIKYFIPFLLYLIYKIETILKSFIIIWIRV